ncbi:MAG: hypothetical protein AB7F76_04905, partial [Parvibaculaceae bacterium]
GQPQIGLLTRRDTSRSPCNAAASGFCLYVRHFCFSDQNVTMKNMTEVENLVLEHLRHIRATTDSLREDMREVKSRLGILANMRACPHDLTASICAYRKLKNG